MRRRKMHRSACKKTKEKIKRKCSSRELQFPRVPGAPATARRRAAGGAADGRGLPGDLTFESYCRKGNRNECRAGAMQRPLRSSVREAEMVKARVRTPKASHCVQEQGWWHHPHRSL